MTNTDPLAKYTTEALEAVLADPKTLSRGDYNAAPYLLKLATPELRLLAVRRAHLGMNLAGGRYSDAVWEAVQETLRIGTEESYDERFNREMLEREHTARCFIPSCTHKHHK